MAPIYEITAGADQYSAHDIVGDSRDILAPTMEGLVEQMVMQPHGNE